MGAEWACRGTNGLFGAGYILQRALVPYLQKPQGERMGYRWAADILQDLTQVSAIESPVPYTSLHPCSLPDWNKGKSLCFYPTQIQSSVLFYFSLPFFFTPFQQNKRQKLFGRVNYQLNTALLTTYTQIYEEIRAALLIRDKPSIL